jgi:hypothetical protein
MCDLLAIILTDVQGLLPQGVAVALNIGICIIFALVFHVLH